MRNCVRVLVACLVMATLAAADTTPAPPVVLVTAFGPFAGRGVNGSETVARSLDQRLIAGARVQMAVLPVLWGEPERRLPELVQRWRPVLLIGLGEGNPGRIAVEQIGRNRAGKYLDEAGKPPTSATLVADGPAQRPVRLAFFATWFANAAIPVVASQDAGDYLCNELLYTALGTSVKLVGFIHLPPQGEVEVQEYVKWLLPVVTGVIERNLLLHLQDPPAGNAIP
jgi:pyroglutamyl-peptidase